MWTLAGSGNWTIFWRPRKNSYATYIVRTPATPETHLTILKAQHLKYQHFKQQTYPYHHRILHPSTSYTLYTLRSGTAPFPSSQRLDQTEHSSCLAPRCRSCGAWQPRHRGLGGSALQTARPKCPSWLNPVLQALISSSRLSAVTSSPSVQLCRKLTSHQSFSHSGHCFAHLPGAKPSMQWRSTPC